MVPLPEEVTNLVPETASYVHVYDFEAKKCVERLMIAICGKLATETRKVLGWPSTDQGFRTGIPHTPPKTKTYPENHYNLAALSSIYRVLVSFNGLFMYLPCNLACSEHSSQLQFS